MAAVDAKITNFLVCTRSFNPTKGYHYSPNIIEGTGGTTHIGWINEPNAKAITDVHIFTFSHEQLNPPPGWAWNATELTKDAGGNLFKYLCWRTDTDSSPIEEVIFIKTEKNVYPPIPPSGFVSCSSDIQMKNNGDINRMWMFYKRASYNFL